jgi:ribosomal protein S18 acetylase RimI-like enzyme
MDLRPATFDDVAAIRAVAQRAYIKYVPRIGRVPAPMAADFLSSVSAGHTHVAINDGQVMGYLIAFARDDDYFVENVAVDPAGAGQGIGKALMALAEDHARDAGRDKVVLYTNARMHENFPFYAALGYRTTGMVLEAGFRRVYFEKDLIADEC